MARVNKITSPRVHRHVRVRAKIFGSKVRPRLSVFRSSAHIYAQIIDDQSGKTLVSSSDALVKEKMTKGEKAKIVGKLIAERAQKAKIKEVVFDRGGFSYHGRVANLADAAREGGLKF